MLMLDAGAGALDYSPCRYGASKAVFRGPLRDLSWPYVAMLGGSATFGKYVDRPFPALVEQTLGRQVVNLGGLNAGPDFYLTDSAALAVAAGACAAVVQLTGAEALSNPFYSVHSRRNDRFLAATPALRALFPQVDFTEIHFTRHLLQVLRRADAGAFDQVELALRQNWLAKMRLLLAGLPARRVLLWLADSPPPDRADSLDRAPLFIDRAMLEALRPEVTAIVLTTPSPRARALAPFDMTYPETEATQAACLPGAAVHAEVAEHLAPVLRGLM
ncbi:DUF6473 family protein [Tabrizicola sp.]|uniref:DUF6473 family protein n=1 Tax=Tabrizicola sp. TaxID=2005166 RepID=UPI001A644C1C|nr:DUF6473 family protein [Tabrizicola sp.]MBL9073772.1 hypothetical protein [Tabrizicola sp.]